MVLYIIFTCFCNLTLQNFILKKIMFVEKNQGKWEVLQVTFFGFSIK